MPATITDRQFDFARDLLAGREFNGETRPAFLARLTALECDPEALRALTAQQASELISYLLAQPRKALDIEEDNERPDVPAGRYAVDNADGELRFYKVDRPTEGRWEGYTFVKVLASDEEHPVRGKAAVSVLEKIAMDPAAASTRYGHEIGRCGICNRTLTDEDSRARGIGPICAAKVGW